MNTKDFLITTPFTGDIVPPEMRGDQWECDGLHKCLYGKSLADLTPEVIENFDIDLSIIPNYLTPEALVYFLPKLLEISLYHFDDGRIGNLSQSLVFFLWRLAKGEKEEKLLKILNTYNKKQLSIIPLFLKEMYEKYYKPLEDDSHALIAYQTFWKQFELEE